MNNKTARIERIEKVWAPDAKLYVPHEGKEIAFAWPSFNGLYQSVGQDILKNSLKVPTGDYTASLLYSAYCNSQVNQVKNEPEFKNVRDLMKNYSFWVFNQNLWTDNGVYVIQDLKAKGKSDGLDINELEKIILKKNGAKEINGVRFSKDGIVRFAPKDTYELGEHTSKSLAKDGFVIASYNIDGAEKLGEVFVATISTRPKIYGVEVSKGDEPKLRVSALDESIDLLHVSGNSWGEYFGAYAFGVL